MFIKKLKITNFQAHINTEINFSDKVNVIVGESDIGKSSIGRAIRWLCYNSPTGTDFITWGKDECSVEALLDSNFTVIRTRNRKTLNRYTIIDPAGNETNYDNFGNEIPLEVKQILQICYFEQDDIDELNVTQQGASNKILHSSPANRARVFNIFTGLDKLDNAMSSIRKDKLQLTKDIKNVDSQKDDLVNRVNTFDYVEEVDKELDKLEELKVKYDKVTKYLTTLQDYKDKYDYAVSQLVKLDKSLKPLKALNVDEDKLKEYQEVLDLYKKVISIYNLNLTDNANISGILDKLSKLQGVFSEINNKNSKLTKLFNKFKQINDLNIKNKEYNISVEKINKSIDAYKVQLTEKETEYVNTLKELKICPTCFREIKEGDTIEACLHD